MNVVKLGKAAGELLFDRVVGREEEIVMVDEAANPGGPGPGQVGSIDIVRNAVEIDTERGCRAEACDFGGGGRGRDDIDGHRGGMPCSFAQEFRRQ